MMKKHGSAARFMAAAMIGAAAAGGAGCAGTSAPRLEYTSAKVTERTPEGVAMEFVVDAHNDNDIALPLRDVEYSVSIDGREVFRGTRSAEATLRRKGVQQVRLPAVIAIGPGEEALSGVRAFRLHGTLTYVTPGKIAELLFDTGVRVPSTGFETEGTVDLGE